MTLDASTRFTTNPAESMNSDTLLQMGFAFAGFIAAAVIVLAFITTAQRKRKLNQVVAESKFKSKNLQKIIDEKTNELAEMKRSLATAQSMVTKAMESEEAMLKPFALLFGDLVFGDTLGEGSFGTVVKGMLRGNIPVAVKTLRVTKLSSEMLNKFKLELKVRAAAVLLLVLAGRTPVN